MGLEIKLFGEPEVLLDGKAVALGAALPTLALFVLWRHRGDVDAETLANALKPHSEAESDRTSFLKKHKKTLRDRLGLTLPETLKLTAIGPAVLEQAWVDVVCFDEKIESGDHREVQKALALRGRGPLLTGLKEPEVFAAERAWREAKYLKALWELFEASKDCPQDALRFLEMQMDCAALPADRAAFLREQRLTLEHTQYRQQEKQRQGTEDGKTTQGWRPPKLPSPLTELIGRDAELEAVQSLLSAHKLVTLEGAGGIGKTRLALAAAHNLQEHFPNGAAFADSSTALDTAQVCRQIGLCLGLEREEDQTEASLLTFLGDKSLLLVWDNCEQLVAVGDSLALLAGEILTRCPGVRILATSRESLRTYGESCCPVLPLPEPDALTLFVARAKAARLDFRPTPENSPTITRICLDLDGLPLAIEIAASLIKTLTPQQILSRLDQRFDLLSDGPRTGAVRHRSLRAVFDVSYELLTPAEQALFRRLGVFPGSFTAEAAAACTDTQTMTQTTSVDAPTLLGRLVHKCLVNMEPSGEEVRYRLLATVRQYAQEQMQAQSEQEETRRRHRSFYLNLAEEADAKTRGPEQTQWLERLGREHDNLRTALSCLRTDHGQEEQQLRFSASLWWFWWVRGYLREGLHFLTEALAGAADAPPGVRARAHEGAGNLLHHLGNDAAAQVELETALEISHTLENSRQTASILGSLGNLAYNQANYSRAKARHQECLEIFQELEDKRGVLVSLINLGNIAYEEKNYSLANQHFQASLGFSRRQKDQRHIAVSLYGLGNAARETGHYLQAGQHLRESLKDFSKWGDQWSLVHVVESLAALGAAQRQGLRATTMLGAAAAIRERIGVPLTLNERSHCDRVALSVRDQLPLEVFTDAWVKGQAMTWEEAVAFALEDATTSPDAA